MKSRLYLLAFPVLALAALPAFAGTPINKTITVTANGNVRVSNVAGSVKVTTWRQNKIHIGGTLGVRAKRLAVEKSEGGVDIRVVLPRNGNINCNDEDECSHLVIELPASSHLRVNTVSADISVNGPSGPVRLESVSGDIALESKSADISVQSVSGDIGITGSTAKARVSAHSVSGEVNIRGVGGELRAGSVSGDVVADASNSVTRAALHSTSGDIRFTAPLAPNGQYDFHSTSGDVTLDLSEIPAARFDATSLSGDIDTNFGPRPQRTSEYGPGREWHYQSGSGGAEVNINTTSGDIRVHASKH